METEERWNIVFSLLESITDRLDRIETQLNVYCPATAADYKLSKTYFADLDRLDRMRQFRRTMIAGL